MAKKDLTGLKFGKLTVLHEADEPYRSPQGKPTRMWICKCECGTEVTVRQNALTASKGGTRSCGCSHSSAQLKRRREVIGERLGKLVVTGEYKLDKPQSNGNTWGLICKCDCGAEIKTTLKDLLSGLKSCGCLLYGTAKKKIEDGVNGRVPGTNLRLIDPTRPANKNNKLGVRGVSWREDIKKYRAKIGFKNRTIELGVFDTLEEAIKARKAAEEYYFMRELNKHKVKNQGDKDEDK